MAKITYDDKVSIITNDVAVTGQWKATDANEVKESVNYLYDAIGWERYFDTANTEESPQGLTELTDNVITIEGLNSIVTEKPNISNNPLWGSNKIHPISPGDCYLIRFDFKASIENANGWFEFSLNVGGDIGKILIGTYTFPKGANTEHSFSLSHAFYTANTFLANGGQILVNPSHSMDIYQKSIFIQRTYFSQSWQLIN